MKTETMTPEQYANKFGIPNGSQEQSLYRFAEEYSEYVNTTASNKTAAGMRWVKCSERLPEKELGNVILKFLGNAWYGHFENHDEGGRMMYIPTKGLYYGRDTWINAEWLDENSPASGKWTEKNLAQLEREINHIFETGANELRVFNMVVAFVAKHFQSPSAGERETVSE